MFQEHGRIASHVAEALDNGRRLRQVEFQVFGGRLDQIDQTAARRLVASAGPAEDERFAGDDGWHRMPDLLAVGIHDPGHDSFVCAQIGSGNVLLRSNHGADFGGEPSREPLEFVAG
jgi:hypothetical protein